MAQNATIETKEEVKIEPTAESLLKNLNAIAKGLNDKDVNKKSMNISVDNGRINDIISSLKVPVFERPLYVAALKEHTKIMADSQLQRLHHDIMKSVQE